MTTPHVDVKNFQKTGSEVEDMLAREQRVSTKQLEDALSDSIPSNNKEKEAAEQKKRLAAEQAARDKKQDAANKAAEKEMNIHF